MILHMAILILLSAEFSSSWGVRPLFLAVPKAWAASSALADSVRQGEVCDCSPGLAYLGTPQVRFPTGHHTFTAIQPLGQPRLC